MIWLLPQPAPPLSHQQIVSLSQSSCVSPVDLIKQLILENYLGWKTKFLLSVGDPDSQVPHVFGPPGSGSFSQRYGFGSGSGSGPFPFLIKDPDPLVRGTDPRIRIRTKMSRIPYTVFTCINFYSLQICCSVLRTGDPVPQRVGGERSLGLPLILSLSVCRRSSF